MIAINIICTAAIALIGVLLSTSLHAQEADSTDNKEHNSLPDPDAFIPNSTPPRYDPVELMAFLDYHAGKGKVPPSRITASVFVRKDGLVQSVLIRKPTGNPDFETAIIEAFKKLIFKPGTQDGQPIDMWGMFSIHINWE